MNIELNKQLFIDIVYPIGSIYISINSTSPETLFGGSWTQITNKFLYCTTTSNTTGGANSVEYTPSGTVGGHTLTVDQIPSHTHTVTTARQYGSGTATDGTPQKIGRTQPNADGLTYTFETNARGGGKSHNHGFTGNKATINTMPSYYTVYAWRRTA